MITKEEYQKNKTEGKATVLPSGLVLNLRTHVSLLDLVARGEIPVPLMNVAATLTSEGIGLTKITEVELMKLPESLKVIHLVVDACIADDEIKAEDLSFMECLLIYNQANHIGGLRPFRPKLESNENIGS